MTEADAIIQKLAKIPCPGWADYHTVGAINPDCCPHCDGTGGKFSWLWKPCPGQWFFEGQWYDDPRHKLCGCGGTCQVPRFDIPLEEAIAQLPDEQRVQVLTRWHDCLPLEVLVAGPTANDVRLAFWQAVENEMLRPENLTTRNRIVPREYEVER